MLILIVQIAHLTPVNCLEKYDLHPGSELLSDKSFVFCLLIEIATF